MSSVPMPAPTSEEDAGKPLRPRFRFTLRTMFAVVTMVAFAVWLFIRYAGFPGVFFAVVVLGAGWCILRGNKGRAVGYLAVFVAAWLTLQFFGPYTSLRNRVVWVVGTERLQQWAVKTLDNPPPADREGRIQLDRDALPEGIRSVAGNYNVVMPSDDGKPDRISFRHGGGFYHWSIFMGRPGFVPRNPSQYDKIADGVWGYRGD